MLLSHGGWCSGCFGFRSKKEQSLLGCPGVCLLRGPHSFDLVCTSLPTWLGCPSVPTTRSFSSPGFALLTTFSSSFGSSSPCESLRGLDFCHFSFLQRFFSLDITRQDCSCSPLSKGQRLFSALGSTHPCLQLLLPTQTRLFFPSHSPPSVSHDLF